MKGFAGLIRNQRGLGVRVEREGIQAARMALLKDDDRIDEDTAKVLVRVEHEVSGAHVDTPMLGVSRALRLKGWETIPIRSRVVGEKKIITMGAASSPEGTMTFRLPEGFLVIGPPLSRGRESPGAVKIDGGVLGRRDYAEASPG